MGSASKLDIPFPGSWKTQPSNCVYLRFFRGHWGSIRLFWVCWGRNAYKSLLGTVNLFRKMDTSIILSLRSLKTELQFQSCYCKQRPNSTTQILRKFSDFLLKYLCVVCLAKHNILFLCGFSEGRKKEATKISLL